MNGVDVIIPIYNAFEDLQICIESLRKTTDLERNRVVLINDCSTDQRVTPYLDRLAEQGFIVIQNEVNRGFSGNVNLGIQQSEDRDVVLLNTDTILTKDWLDKLIRCAYSDSAIATVTPLSNNATLCSVPAFCEENRLPEGFTLDEFADLVDRSSLRRYPRITVVVGFCMYIKREVIRLIGNFDSETFERGYGEENDFCCRAEQAGYYHAMCDDAYVYHTGSKSFVSKEKQTYMEEHETILNQRYPLQMQRNREHVRDNPNSFAQDTLKIYIPFHNGRKNILYLAQSDFLEEADDHVGGIQLHVKDLTMGLKDRYNIFVAARDQNYVRCTGYTDDKIVKLKFYVGDKPDFPVFRSQKLREIYDNLLNAFSIDMVHVHHVLGMSLEIYEAARKLGIPVITTIHDYYMVCPSGVLLDYKGNACDKNVKSCEYCRECLSNKFQYASTVNYQNIWRKRNLEALRISDKIVVPSVHTGDVISDVYPEIREKVQVIGHGTDLRKPENRLKPREEKIFHVAFVGGINEEKGSQIICNLIKKSDTDIEWYIFGGIGDRDLLYLEKKNLHKMGVYSREQLPELVEKNQIDLICLLSICPETYCYTLSEAVACGVPVLASDIGALGERVREMNCGWVLDDVHNTDSVLAKINELKKRPDEYWQCVEHVQKLQMRTTEEMTECYDALYKENLRQRESGMAAYDAEVIYRAYALANGKGIAGTDVSGDILERLNNAERNLNILYNSGSYKLLNKLKSLPIPGKSHIKAILYRLYKKGR
ncbi:MAG: glycosyltransferase [Lachnospiraceae bacterium]|nr:glycosyltransferase [Lachnospiraceae bacterium]